MIQQKRKPPHHERRRSLMRPKGKRRARTTGRESPLIRLWTCLCRGKEIAHDLLRSFLPSDLPLSPQSKEIRNTRSKTLAFALHLKVFISTLKLILAGTKGDTSACAIRLYIYSCLVGICILVLEWWKSQTRKKSSINVWLLSFAGAVLCPGLLTLNF